MEYAKLKEELMIGDYSSKQFTEIKAIADIRLGNFSAKESALNELNKNSSDTYAILLHGRLENVFRRECNMSILPYSKLKAIFPKAARNLRHVANTLFVLSERWNTDKARTRNFTIGVYHLYCKLVVSYLRDNRVPVSLKTSLQHIDKFEGLVDKAFPGYIENGMISVIVLGDKKLQ